MNFYLSFLAYNCWRIIITAVIAYLLGSVNTAVIVTKIVTGGKKDIREMGSGNAGFTNVLRSVGKVPAIFTIVCDALKCVVAVIPVCGYFGVCISEPIIWTASGLLVAVIAIKTLRAFEKA